MERFLPVKSFFGGLYNGCTMVIQWLYNGYTVVVQWLYVVIRGYTWLYVGICGYTMVICGY